MPTTWFDLLGAERDALSPEELFMPAGEVGEGDHIVGSVADDIPLQGFFTLGMRLAEAAERAGLDARWEKDPAKQEELLARANELGEKGRHVLEAFWIAVKDSFGLWGQPSVGVREGWQVVRSDQDTSLPPFLRNLLGDPPDQ